MRYEAFFVLCISRKVKKSESKSQQFNDTTSIAERCVYPVKLKNLKANHNPKEWVFYVDAVVYIP